MEEFQHFKSEAEANQQQDLLSDGFVRVENPPADDHDLFQPKPASDIAEEDLYSATPSSDQGISDDQTADLVSFDSSPNIDNNPLVDTVSAPADSSSDPEPQFTEGATEPDQQAPVEDLLGGFGSSDPESPQDEFPKTNECVALENNSTSLTPSSVFGEEPTPTTTNTDNNIEDEPTTEIPDEPTPSPPPVIEDVKPVKPSSTASPVLISSSPCEGALIDLSRLDPRVVDLVYWRDPKKSGVAFGSILIVLLAFVNFSSISVVAYLLLSILTVTISFRVYKHVLQAVQKTGEGNPFKPYLEKDISISEEEVSEYAVKAVEKINEVVAAVRRYLLVEDLVESIKFAVFLWLVTYIGCLFNGLTLVILAHIGLFTIPLIYEMNKAQIDEVLGKAYTKFTTTYEQLKEKVPFLKKKTE